MKAQHTLAPWTAHGDTIWNDDSIIARCSTKNEAEANARLIAAAPELLEALQAMVDMFERHIDGREGPADAAQRWDNARDAITKATA